MAGALKLKADIATLEDRVGDARHDYEGALGVLTQHPWPPIEWQIRKAYAELNRRMGESGAGGDQVRHARAVVNSVADSVPDEKLRQVFLTSRPVPDLRTRARPQVMSITLNDLRRFAVAHSLFTPTTLKRALNLLGFVQADPIRAPARAQDLILRHRVKDYRAGDLERLYTKLGVEEDFFVTYGFVTRSLHALMHPRSDTGVPAESREPWPAAPEKHAPLLLAFVPERAALSPP